MLYSRIPCQICGDLKQDADLSAACFTQGFHTQRLIFCRYKESCGDKAVDFIGYDRKGFPMFHRDSCAEIVHFVDGRSLTYELPSWNDD